MKLTAEQFEISKSSPTAGAREHQAYVSTAKYGLIDAAVRWFRDSNAELRTSFEQ